MIIGIDIQLDVADVLRVFVSGSCARGAHNRTRSMRSELCEHPLTCFLLFTAVKIGMNIQLDMAYGWRVLVSGS